jgi:hypothetical protein
MISLLLREFAAAWRIAETQIVLSAAGLFMSRLARQIIRIVSAERIDGSNCRVLCKYSVGPARAMTVSKKKRERQKKRGWNGAASD